MLPFPDFVITYSVVWDCPCTPATWPHSGALLPLIYNLPCSQFFVPCTFLFGLGWLPPATTLPIPLHTRASLTPTTTPPPLPSHYTQFTTHTPTCITCKRILPRSLFSPPTYLVPWSLWEVHCFLPRYHMPHTLPLPPPPPPYIYRSRLNMPGSRFLLPMPACPHLLPRPLAFQQPPLRSFLLLILPFCILAGSLAPFTVVFPNTLCLPFADLLDLVDLISHCPTYMHHYGSLGSLLLGSGVGVLPRCVVVDACPHLVSSPPAAAGFSPCILPLLPQFPHPMPLPRMGCSYLPP